MTEPAYPAHREVDISLRDGSTLHVRPLRPDDRDELLAFFEGLSPEARALRFFSAAANLAHIADALTAVDFRDSYGIVATSGPEGRLVGHASYAQTAPGEAEVAFAVAAGLRGKGVATVLLAHLAESADEAGIPLLRAEVLPGNRAMMEVFQDSGFPVEISSRAGVIDVAFPSSLSDQAVGFFENRDRLAAVAAVSHVLEPSSVAVIGASTDWDKIGGRVFHNLISGGFAGPVYPVNPGHDSVQSVRAYATIAEVPDPVELAVIAVPATAVAVAARECAEAGVRALVVISAGFAEVGKAGTERQRELLEICRESGMRLVGPNCLGVVNTAPGIELNASFGPEPPTRGNVGMMTQSGALGLALIAQAAERGIGVSSFASVGNKADISGNDLLAYWEQNDETRVILLYLESFGNPRRFSRIAPRTARHKPIIAVKSGRTATGARAAGSHTGAMLASSDVSVDALLREAGVIRADGLSDLLGVSSLLAKQPLPAGPRVGIVTNAGGPGIMCADACEAARLEVPGLGEAVRARLAEVLPDEAALANPVDMLATATPDQYRAVIDAVAESGEVDALIVIFIEPLLIRSGDVVAAVEGAIVDDCPLPVLNVLMSEPHSSPAALAPSFRYPESAVTALAGAVHYARWREQPERPMPRLDDVDPIAAGAAIAAALDAGEDWMAPEHLSLLLDAYRVPQVASQLARDADDAASAAAVIGYPVALKAVAPGIVHKSDIGAVRLGVDRDAELRRDVDEIRAVVDAHGAELEGVLVQAMAPAGPELIVGVTNDPMFGPLIVCGAGGVEAELINDIAIRLGPVAHSEALEMLTELATYPRLTGYRGAAPVDLDALADLIVRISVMADAHEEIRELDLNPVIAATAGATAVDARVRVEPAAPRRPWPST